MRNLLIIYPHWPPSNLAGVHRARLIANFTFSQGWKSIVLTVDPGFYEEAPDPDLVNTVSPDVEVVYTRAYRVSRPRLIGDIGLRAFSFLYRKALEIINQESVDFVWIPIPSFYTALLGRKIHRKTGVPFGIDYIDPWVRDISGRSDLRHRLSNFLARFLEPIAVKKAALITGVSYDYYQPVLERNFSNRPWKDPLTNNITNDQKPKAKSQKPIFHTSFPYGFDPSDHEIKLDDLETPWDRLKKYKIWLYAGAFLPNSRVFVSLLFQKIAALRQAGKWDSAIRLHFIGTGNYPGKSILEYAKDCALDDIVFEDKSRFPFLQVLNLLSLADTVMVIGSTEKHYTASKVYQAILSKRPVWSIFHRMSSALKTLEECKADQFSVRYTQELTKGEIEEQIEQTLLIRISSNTWDPEYSKLEKYSAKESTRKLLHAIDHVLISSQLTPHSSLK